MPRAISSSVKPLNLPVKLLLLQDKPCGSKKSKKVFGWSALWSTISATSIWRKKLCSLSTTLLAQKCNLCLRYDLSPMSPGRTRAGPENDGRPVGTRTPDLYRVNSPSEVGEDEKK